MVERTDEIDVERLYRSTDISLEESYRLLADDRTRAVLRTLCATERTITLEELVDAIVAQDRGASDSTGEDPERRDGRETIRLWLVHVVLPKLEGHGLVTVDRDGHDRPVVEGIEAHLGAFENDTPISGSFSS